MSDQEMVKVYELAKELGMDSFSLLDKLKTLNIQVKNHMSDLKSTEVETVRTSLKKSEPARKNTKKALTKVRKKSEPVAAETIEASAPEKKSSSPIIRRRLKTDGGSEVSTTLVTPGDVHKTSADDHPHEDDTLSHSSSLTSDDAAEDLSEPAQTVEELTEEVQAMTEIEADESSPLETSALSESADVEAPSDGIPAEEKQEAAPPTVATVEAVEIKPPAAPVKPARPPIVLTPRPVAPRRSILKIVEASAPPPRPIIKPAPVVTPAAKATVKGTTTQDKDGFRIIKMTKENLDQMVEEEAAKKRGGGREPEIRPEDVRFADYRKKELVFLPKKKKIPVGKEIRKTQKTQAKAQKRVVQMQDQISVQDLANELSIKSIELIRKLMGMGQMVTINQSLDYDTASLIASEYQYEVKNVAFNENSFINGDADEEADLSPRPPVVTIMGHVDHGKTTLLDSIREANVAAGEAGGITQHIGAYSIEKNGKWITFIDTPGHEAFSVMRARGANVTDIVILVVSADDGVMPQTREAVSHAQAAKVPIIVAVNKMDKPGANPDKIRQALSDLNLLSEEWGGETIFVQVSALKKTNIDKLLDAVLLQAEILDLKANPNSLASGTVLESKLERGKGPVASMLVRRGTLKLGDPIVAGTFSGKIKALTNHQGKMVKSVGPGMAAEILGLEGVPNAGEAFNTTKLDAEARNIADDRANKARRGAITGAPKMSFDDLFAKIQSGSMKELNVILKADAYGSVEAIRDSLVKLSSEKVKVKILLAAAGGITESDILLASASNALILGFNVRPETKARQVAEAEHIDIQCYSIIYELIDDVKKAMTGLLDKKKVEKFLGRAEVRQTFSVPKIGLIAGSFVVDGKNHSRCKYSPSSR